MCIDKNEEMASQHHLDENLTNAFVSYIISIKENGDELGYTRVMTALFTALGKLDKKYNTPKFIKRMRDDFLLISQHLDVISKNMYKEKRISEGCKDRSLSSLEKTYTVLEVSKKLDVTEQAIRKNIKLGKLKAQKVGNSYRVASKDLDDFINNRKRS